MPVLLGFLIILFFWALGTVVTMLINHLIPGSVVGLLLLFVALCFKLVRPEQIRAVAKFLTKNMSLFFVPAPVGLMEHLGVLKDGWAFILVASVLSTILVMAVVALIRQKGDKTLGR
ncbi:MAG: CidA/LrgA family protein [Prevotellaceae bacterium]|jgi:holin-like protein|nr:CidA/LrgA family protein [Prevotellaceae bacterium]